MNNMIIYGQMDIDLRFTVKYLRDRNVRVVVRDEEELNAIRIREARQIAAQQGHIAAQQEKEDWDREVSDHERIHTTKLGRWRQVNKVFVDAGAAFRVKIDTKSLRNVMRRMFRGRPVRQGRFGGPHH